MSKDRSRRSPIVTTAAIVASVAVGAGVGIPLYNKAIHGMPRATSSTCDVSSSLAGWADDDILVSARAVSDGHVLIDHGAETPNQTASNMKLLTMSAALVELGPSFTIPTRVVAGNEPGTVVLVGGGDPTLSRLPSGTQSVYQGAPHLDTLAATVKKAWSVDPELAKNPISRVVVDASIFSGSDWQPSWPLYNRPQGSMPSVQGLMVDGDRDDPTMGYSSRGENPSGRAASAFASLLGPDVQVVTDEPDAPRGDELGEVHSRPVSELVKYALTNSDNTLAEALGRLVAINAGKGSSFDSIQAGTTAALTKLGLDTSGLVLKDASGLSPNDRVTPAFMTSLLVKIVDEKKLSPVYAGLPISGETGTLAENGRFQRANQQGRGKIHAKTGTLPDMLALSGVTDAENGTRVVFTIWVTGATDDTVRTMLDALAVKIWHCGGLVNADTAARNRTTD